MSSKRPKINKESPDFGVLSMGADNAFGGVFIKPETTCGLEQKQVEKKNSGDFLKDDN